MTLSLSPTTGPCRVSYLPLLLPYTYRTRTRIGGTHTPRRVARNASSLDVHLRAVAVGAWCCASRERDKDVAGEKRERKKKGEGTWVGGLRVEEG